MTDWSASSNSRNMADYDDMNYKTQTYYESDKTWHIYYDFYQPFLISNSLFKIILWTIYLLIICPLILLIHLIFKCLLKKEKFTNWFFTKAFYSGTFLFFILSFTPFWAGIMYEWRFNEWETKFEKTSFGFATIMGFVMLVVQVMITFLTIWHHWFHEVKKIWDWFNILFMPFWPPITCSLYYPLYMVWMLVLITCLVTI